MVEIKDEDILHVFKLGEKTPKDLVLHGILRNKGITSVVFERNSGEPYTGFLERSIIDFSNLGDNQVQFLRDKGYNI